LRITQRLIVDKTIPMWTICDSFVYLFVVYLQHLDKTYTNMRRLTTVMRYEKCVVRRFRPCADVYLHNLDSAV